MIYITTKVSGGRLLPENDEEREYWTYKMGGQLPWFLRIIQDPKAVFRAESPVESRSTRAHSESNGSAAEINTMMSQKV